MFHTARTTEAYEQLAQSLKDGLGVKEVHISFLVDPANLITETRVLAVPHMAFGSDHEKVNRQLP